MVTFSKDEFVAEFTDAAGNPLRRVQQVRKDPVTLQQCRITPSRSVESERGTEKLYEPPASDLDRTGCPFCPKNIERMTPCLSRRISSKKRLVNNSSILFPNLFPYTEWSAVSLFDDTHHVAIGTAEPAVYRDSFLNCSDYLARVKRTDPDALFMSITQNHLPGAGGSLVHPHLQVHATRKISNNHRTLLQRGKEHRKQHDSCIFEDLLQTEKELGERYLGDTGPWAWAVAFAPSGFYEIWGIAAGVTSLLHPGREELWQGLADGLLRVQKFYRRLNRNAYNLSLLSMEDDRRQLSLRVRVVARASYAPWVRSDITGFEMGSGEMATFTLPEEVALMARNFWHGRESG